MKSISALTLAVSTLAGGLAACSPAPDPAWSGYAEGDYVYVASPIAGRLTELLAPRGSAVVAGALLFKLDGATESAARGEALARLGAARAQSANTDKGRRADEQAVVRAQWQQARAAADTAESEWKRQRQLVAQGFISASKLDDARAAAEQARAHVAEIEAALRVASLPARDDERSAARANAQALEQALQQADWRAQQTQQRALAAGTVADSFFQPGEWVPAGQAVLSLLPVGAIKARFYVPEGELGTLAMGQPVTLSCSGCGAPIAARIDFIASAAEYTPPVIYSNAQRSRLVFRVEARPDARDAPRLKPGQPLDVRPAAAAKP